VTANVTLRTGYDVRYFLDMSDEQGEPPGQWAGKAAATLGLDGEVDPDVICRLYQEDIGPDGQLLAGRGPRKTPDECAAAAVAAHLAEHPYASATELAVVRSEARAGDAASVPYYDLTITAAKSVAVLHASHRLTALRAQEAANEEAAKQSGAKADELDLALLGVAREAIAWLEAKATYTRTGPGGCEWRDGAGLVSALFLYHVSRAGNPDLRVHAVILNRVQRADGADGTWRALAGEQLSGQRPSVTAIADLLLQAKMTGLGYRMVPRADGNGCEVGGVSQELIDMFSD
jgi:hypothetical protein